MFIRFVFIVVLMLALLSIGELTRKKGFEKLKIWRKVEKSRVRVGEEFTIQTVVENNKWLPVSFVVISERVPMGLRYTSDEHCFKEGQGVWHVSKYSLGWFERRKRTYTLVAQKRGTYIIRNIQTTIGDVFGFAAENRQEEDYVEVVVYPTLKDIRNYQFTTTNFQGDQVIHRWLFKDPLYIKGIREYSVEDRMKDIHWKSSLKMNKLMVKEYDYTSEREIVLLLNVQCGNPYWSNIQEKPIENGIKLAVSLASKAIQEGIPVGMWTNAQLIAFEGNFSNEVPPSINNLRTLMEMGARVDYNAKMDFKEYLDKNRQKFDTHCTYILITPFLDEGSVNTLTQFRRKGYQFKMIDVSLKGNVPSIEGIEKIQFKEEAM